MDIPGTLVLLFCFAEDVKSHNDVRSSYLSARITQLTQIFLYRLKTSFRGEHARYSLERLTSIEKWINVILRRQIHVNIDIE